MGRPILFTDGEGNDSKNFLTKPTADALYMNTNEQYTADLDMTGNRILNVADPIKPLRPMLFLSH